MSTQLSKSIKRHSKTKSLPPSPKNQDPPSPAPSSASSDDTQCDYFDIRDEFATETHEVRTRLSETDFKLVKLLAEPLSKLTAARSHITTQLSVFNQSIKNSKPPTYFKITTNPPHPHRGMTFHPAFLENWDRLSSKVSLAFVRLTIEEYTHQAQVIEEKRQATLEEVASKLVAEIKEQEL